MSDSSSGYSPPGDQRLANSQGGWPVVWLIKNEPLPNSCISCGMFTDIRKAARVSTEETQLVTQKASNGLEAVGCLLHLLGPIGFLFSLAMQNGNSDETIEQRVKVKTKIKLPVCRLCAGQQIPETLQSNSATGRYAFQVHPRFAEELTRLRQQST